MSSIVPFILFVVLGAISFGNAICANWDKAIFFLILAGFLGIAILIARNKSRYVFNQCTVFFPAKNEDASSDES